MERRPPDIFQKNYRGQPFKGIYGAKLYVYAQGCEIKGGAPLFPFFQVK